MGRSVRLQDSVYLFSCFSNVSSIQTPEIKGKGFFFVDLDLEKHYVKLGLQVIWVPASSNTNSRTCTNFTAVFGISGSHPG